MKYGHYPDVYFPSYMFFQNMARDLEHLRRIFDLLPIGVMATNTEGIIIYYNRAHARLDGLSPQEVLGRPEAEVFGFPDVSPGIMRACQKMGKPILGFMCPYFTAKNKNKIIRGAYWVFPLFDADKKIMGSVCFTIPITEGHEQAQVKHVLWPNYMPVSRASKKIVGENPLLRKGIELARTRADSPSAVLISGETGTGKELFARLIHDSSKRAQKPFVPINCAAIPGHLLEGLLFGTTKGSFTGAVDKAGLFEEANGGTVYLDEIDSIPMDLQPKLLRVLQEMKVSRLGAGREIKLDLKIVSSIGTPIHEVLVRELMRPDLFYRLAVIVINVPPLRERMDDLDELINYFIAKYNKQLGKKVVGFDMATKIWLKKYAWPGNVRELENLIASSVNMVEKESLLTRDHLPDHYIYQIEQQSDGGGLFFSQPKKDSSIRDEYHRLADYPLYDPPNQEKIDKMLEDSVANSFFDEELETLKEHLAKARGKLVTAAATLGISRQLLRYKMNKYGLTRYDFLPKLGSKAAP